MNVKGTNQSRALYNVLKSDYTAKYNSRKIMQMPIITESYLLLQASLQGTITSVQFNVLNNQGATPQTVIENRLNITDKFCVKDMAFALMRSATTTTAIPTAAQAASGIPYTYPNSTAFSAANEALNLEAVYNGQARIVIDSTVYYQSLDLRRFYRVPTSQYGTTSAAIAGPVLYPIARDGWDSLNWAFSPVYPTFEFNGIGKNELSVTLPNPTNTAAASGSWNSLICYCRGYLIQNVNQRS